jgi:hypothetical protein
LMTLVFRQYFYHLVLPTTSTTPLAMVDIHDSRTSVLDLLQWERDSIFSNDTDSVVHSKAPPNTPVTCSLGSIASYGKLFTTKSCGGGEATYARVLQKVKDLIGLDDTVCDVCRIFDLSRVHNLTTISFWGDSVQNQVFDGFVCETSRRNYTIISDESEPTSCTANECIQSIRTVKIRTSAVWDHYMTLKFFFQYRPSTDMEANVRPIVADGTDVLFFNFGLHFHPHETSGYQDRMRIVMNELKKTSHNISLLAFRETSAQHFNGDGGEYKTKTRNGSQCGPLDTTATKNSLFGWRDRVFSASAEQSGFRVLVADPGSKNSLSLLPRTIDNEVVVVPFANFSAELYDLHPKNECTHYCSTPHLWFPLWRSLRFAMSRRFGSS